MRMDFNMAYTRAFRLNVTEILERGIGEREIGWQEIVERS